MYRRSPGASTRSTRAHNIRLRAIAASASAMLALGGVAVLAVPAQAVPTFDITPDSGPTTGGTHVSFMPDAELQFVQIATGAYFSIALTTDGEVYGWGSNYHHQLAKDHNGGSQSDWTEARPFALTMPDGVTYEAVSAGSDHALALGSDGNVYAWGNNQSGRLGAGPMSQPTGPVQVSVPTGVTFTSVVAGDELSLALDSEGRAYAWGDGADGKLGNGTTSGSQWVPTAVAMPAGVTFTSMATGLHHALALDSDGNAYAWGRGADGALGTGGTAVHSVPTPVTMPADVTFTSIAAGGDTSWALDTHGNAWSWGSASHGQLGNGIEGGPNALTPVPVSMPAGVTFTSVQGGVSHVLATGSDGNVYAWGSGTKGMLGTGAEDSEYVPVQVSTPAGVTPTQVDGGDVFSAALDSTGTLFTWGSRTEGVLGDGYLPRDALVPKEVPGQRGTVNLVRFGGRFTSGSWVDAGTGMWTVPTPVHAAGTVDVEFNWHVFGRLHPVTLIDAFTYVEPLTVPGAPTDVVGVAGNGQVALTWQAPDEDGGSPVTDYVVEYSADGGVTWAVFDEGVSATPGATVTGLTNGTEYVFRVTALNDVGTGALGETAVSVTPVAPEVPDETGAPEDPEVPLTPDAPVAGSADDELAATGVGHAGLLAIGAWLVAMLGVGAVLISRRTSAA